MQRLSVLRPIVFLLVAAVSLPALAQTHISGSDNPTLQNAMDLWLDGDDETALPAMAKLAKNGNKAARLLLSQIELHSSNGSEFLGSLSKKEKRLLFRSDQGAFGKTWLAIEGKTDPFAQALLDWRHIDRRVGAIPILLENGEKRIAMKAILHQAQQSDGSLLILGKNKEVPAQIQHVLWLEAVSVSWFAPNKKTGFEDDYIDDANKALSNGDLIALIWISSVRKIDEAKSEEKRYIEIGNLLRGREFLAEHAFDRANLRDFERILMGSEWYESVRQPCARLCRREWRQCTHAAFSALGGHDAAVTLGTPLQSLISDDDHHESRRAEVQLVRALRQSPSNMFHSNVRKISACLADYIEN